MNYAEGKNNVAEIIYYSFKMWFNDLHYKFKS